MPAQEQTNDIVARAQALIEEVQRQLDRTEEFYRSQGLDPNKVHIVLQAHSTPDSERQARDAFEADMLAVEQEVEEGRARLAFGAAASNASAARRPRMMI
ncbi:hypothetical protein MASR1M59_22770 [Melaminivora sp.]